MASTGRTYSDDEDDEDEETEKVLASEFAVQAPRPMGMASGSSLSAPPMTGGSNSLELPKKSRKVGMDILILDPFIIINPPTLRKENNVIKMFLKLYYLCSSPVSKMVVRDHHVVPLKPLFGNNNWYKHYWTSRP